MMRTGNLSGSREVSLRTLRFLNAINTFEACPWT